MRSTRAKSGTAPGHPLSGGAVRLPPDEAVQITLAVVLVGKVNVVITVKDEAMAIYHISTCGRPKTIRHVLIPKIALPTDDGVCSQSSGNAKGDRKTKHLARITGVP
jgi:hypothetical protein